MNEIKRSDLNNLKKLKDEFKQSLDVCETTKRAYTGALDKYFNYLIEFNQDGSKAQTVIEYKHYLIDQGG